MNNPPNTALQLLSPYGNWPHSKGMQVVDKIAGEKIRNAFMRGFNRIWGLPIYVGHPDEKGKSAKAVGRIESISTTDEGIIVSARYSNDAYQKLLSGKLKWLSPRWQMQALGNGKFRPVKLISVGMTSNPNIPNSGKILTPNLDKKFLEDKISKIGKLKNLERQSSQNLAKLSKQAQSIAKKTENLNGDFLEASLKKMSRTPEPCELARLALERSKNTGESYIESFCAIRRKYFGTNSAKKSN